MRYTVKFGYSGEPLPLLESRFVNKMVNYLSCIMDTSGVADGDTVVPSERWD